MNTLLLSIYTWGLGTMGQLEAGIWLSGSWTALHEEGSRFNLWNLPATSSMGGNGQM